MNTLNKMLDSAIKACALSSDAQLAAKLGVSRSAVSLWRQGRVIKEDHLAALLQLSKCDPIEALRVLEEQASTKASKSLWHHAVMKLSSAAMLGVMYIM